MAENTPSPVANGDKPAMPLGKAVRTLLKWGLVVNLIIAVVIVLANASVLNALAGAANYDGAGKWVALIMSSLVSLGFWVFFLFFFEFVLGAIGMTLYMIFSGAWTGKAGSKAQPSAAADAPSQTASPQTTTRSDDAV